MAVSLYPAQREAVEQLKNGSILCGGVGSGKSRTSLAYYYKMQDGDLDYKEYMPMKKDPQDLYIITTAMKRDRKEWDVELAEFLLTPVKELNPHGNTVVIDSWNNIGKYVGVEGAFFIFDEQRVVGSGAWVKSFLKITKKNYWILLSATPGDKYEDYIPVFIANGFYRNKTEFMREHVVFNTYLPYPKIDRYLNTRKLDRLRDSILVDIDVHRHTIPHHSEIWVPYNRFDYRIVHKDRWNIFENKPVETAAELCYLLRKVVNCDDSRSVAVLELFEKHQRAIIFYNFDYELEILRDLYYGEDVVVAEWNGHKHQPIPDSEKWVYLVQYTAGCEGWNCVLTDTIIFYSQNYSYKVVTQACGRIDRLNTPFTDLYYYHLISKSDIDLSIRRALAQKKKFNEGRYAKRFIFEGAKDTPPIMNKQSK